MFNKFIISPIRKMYDKVFLLAGSKKAVWWLAAVAFCESIFFPIPQDVMLIPMMLANRKKAYFYATVCLIASVLGGIAGYFIGSYLYNEVAMPILQMYGYADKLDYMKHLFQTYGWWIVIGGGLSPIPYKLITISSGAMGLSLPVFILSAILSRMIRFYALAFLTHLLGHKILEFVDKYFAMLTILFFALLISGFLMIELFL